MISQSQLDTWLQKSMTDICLNGYVSPTFNHCAHFVSHAMNIQRGYTCRHATSGKEVGANLRVHEVFSFCSNHEEINQTNPAYSGLVFVSGRSHFHMIQGIPNLENVRKKHIGIIHQGFVWHFSNTRHMVIKQPMSEFLFHYPGQENALWFANPPAGYRGISFGQC